jgi:hypothetical protein
MSHGVLSARPLRARARFEFKVLQREYYIQLGVCHVPQDLTSVLTNTPKSWVYFTEDNAAIFSDSLGAEMEVPQGELPPISQGDRIGMAVDLRAGAAAARFYHNGRAVATVRGIPTNAPLYICAFLGGTNTSVRLEAPSFEYEYPE